MKGLTKVVTASALGLSLSVSAMAADGTQNNISSIDLPVSDLSYAFDNDKDLQVSSISNEEMTDTQGAVLPFVAGALMGGASSAWMNHGLSYAKTGRLASTRSTVAATGAGMVGGAYTNGMLRGAGIATSMTNRAAWKGGTGVGNAVIRGNGAAIGKGTVGVWGQKK